MKFDGVYPVIASTFSENGDLDIDSFVNLLKVMTRGGCHGVTLFGIAGEYYKLTETEEHKLIEATVRECKDGKSKSVISVTKHASEVSATWAKELETAGADCLMLLPPFFLKPSVDGILDHIRVVNDAVNIPIMLQYAPEQTGVSIAPDLLIQITKQCKNVKILKIENKPPGGYVSKLINSAPDVQIFVGNAGFQMIENFDRGARGVMPGCSMFDVYLKIYNNFINGRRKFAMDIHNDLVALLNHIRQNVEMIIFFEKKILKRRGFIANDYCRKPSFKPDDHHLQLFDDYYELIEQYFDSSLNK